MKTTVGQLRQFLREEYLRGVPEFVLRGATEKYIDEIRNHVKKYILQVHSNDYMQQRESIAAANEVLEDLEEKSNELLEDALFSFMQGV